MANKTLIIIDDNAADRLIIQECLTDEGVLCDVTIASTGEEGIQQAKSKSPQVVVLDTNLPGIDGFETCRRIKQVERIDTKVIMSTGVVDAIDAVRAREMGADDYCVKTSDCAQLVTLIKEILGKGDLKSELE